MPLLTVHQNQKIHQINILAGSNLRSVLVENKLSLYTALTEKLNCGGNGICATCGIIPIKNVPQPVHWHDRLAHQFNYPRLSCQILIHEDMTVQLDTEKKIWGKPLHRRK